VSFKVKVRTQVWAFASSLGLEHRRAFKRAVLGLAQERGDIRPLGDQLAGFHRLKVARYRVIFFYQPGQVIECVFAEERKLVYEIFEAEMGRILGEESS
jgi:mRNA interferase RelE/StbE